MSEPTTAHEKLRHNIRLMQFMKDLALPTLEIHGCINQLEDILDRKAEALEKQSIDPNVDETYLFYAKVLKSLWIASISQDKLAAIQTKMERATMTANMYRELNGKLEKELRKYEVLEELITDNELEYYMEKTKAAMNLLKQKNSTTNGQD
jgi:hypothetical protein